MSRSSDESRQSSDDSSHSRISRVAVLIERRIGPFAERFGNSPAVRALRESLTISFVGLLVGLFVIVAFVEKGSFVDRLQASIPGAFTVMSITLVIVLSFRLATRFRYLVAPTVGASILAFAFALPRDSMHPLSNFPKILGTSGLFTAIVTCLATVGVIGLMRRRFPGDRGVAFGAFAVWIGSYALYALHLSIGGAVAALISPISTLGDSFVALFVITAIEVLLWLVGIHGPALLTALVLPVYLKFQLENTAAFAHHLPLPHLVVVSSFLFVFPGGAGATMSLIVLLLRSRVPRLRKFAYAMLVPSLINTNEPIMFGLPLVYNPILGIPFVIAPLVLVCTTYAAFAFGLVRAPITYIPTGFPIFVNTFLATLDWRSLVLMAVNLIIAGLIYVPFVRVYERIELNKTP